MDAITTPKSPQANRLEGFALTACSRAPDLRRRRADAQAGRQPRNRRRPTAPRSSLLSPALFFALITPALGRKIPEPVQAWLRAAVLRRQPALRRKDRALAHPARDLAATGDQRDAAVAAGGGRGECGVRLRHPVGIATATEIPGSAGGEIGIARQLLMAEPRGDRPRSQPMDVCHRKNSDYENLPCFQRHRVSGGKSVRPRKPASSVDGASSMATSSMIEKLGRRRSVPVRLRTQTFKVSPVNPAPMTDRTGDYSVRDRARVNRQYCHSGARTREL